MAKPVRQQRAYLTVAETARILQISTFGMYKLLRRSVVPFYRFGNSIRIRVADVAAFIERSKH